LAWIVFVFGGASFEAVITVEAWLKSFGVLGPWPMFQLQEVSGKWGSQPVETPEKARVVRKSPILRKIVRA